MLQYSTPINRWMQALRIHTAKWTPPNILVWFNTRSTMSDIILIHKKYHIMCKFSDWMRIGAFTISSGKAVATHSLEKKMDPRSSWTFDNVKTGIWIAGTLLSPINFEQLKSAGLVQYANIHIYVAVWLMYQTYTLCDAPCAIYKTVKVRQTYVLSPQKEWVCLLHDSWSQIALRIRTEASYRFSIEQEPCKSWRQGTLSCSLWMIGISRGSVSKLLEGGKFLGRAQKLLQPSLTKSKYLTLLLKMFWTLSPGVEAKETGSRGDIFYFYSCRIMSALIGHSSASLRLIRSV